MTILKSQDTYTKLFWIYTAVMMLIATPLALVLVFVKLFSVRAKKNADFRPAPGSPLGARTTARSAAAIGLNQASKKMRRRAAQTHRPAPLLQGHEPHRRPAGLQRQMPGRSHDHPLRRKGKDARRSI